MIHIIGFPGCGTTSLYRYLKQKGKDVEYHNGIKYSEIGYGHVLAPNDDYIIITRKSLKAIRESNKKRRRTKEWYLANFRTREKYWKKLGVCIVYLEDMAEMPDFPKLNKFLKDTKLMVELKRENDKITDSM